MLYNTHDALCQITRSHYQNAVTATRMDSSPQTPDADARLTEGNMLSPEPPPTEHTATLMPPQHTTTTLMPPPREPSRPSSARSRAQQSSVPHSTSLLNEKNSIVREYTGGTRTELDANRARLNICTTCGRMGGCKAESGEFVCLYVFVLQEVSPTARRVPVIPCS